MSNLILIKAPLINDLNKRTKQYLILSNITTEVQLKDRLIVDNLH